MRLAQLSYEQLLNDGKLDIQFGFMADFGYARRSDVRPNGSAD
jgi:hypothetical protein